LPGVIRTAYTSLRYSIGQHPQRGVALEFT
jgi:hypothetical protein